MSEHLSNTPKDVHLSDIKKTHNACKPVIKQDRHPDLINFGLYHDLHVQIRHMVSCQPSPIPCGGPPVQDIRIFVHCQIRSLVFNVALGQRLDKRADILYQEEYADFTSHRDELRAAGFIRST